MFMWMHKISCLYVSNLWLARMLCFQILFQEKRQSNNSSRCMWCQGFSWSSHRPWSLIPNVVLKPQLYLKLYVTVYQMEQSWTIHQGWTSCYWWGYSYRGNCNVLCSIYNTMLWVGNSRLWWIFRRSINQRQSTSKVWSEYSSCCQVYPISFRKKTWFLIMGLQ